MHSDQPSRVEKGVLSYPVREDLLHHQVHDRLPLQLGRAHDVGHLLALFEAGAGPDCVGVGAAEEAKVVAGVDLIAIEVGHRQGCLGAPEGTVALSWLEAISALVAIEPVFGDCLWLGAQPIPARVEECLSGGQDLLFASVSRRICRALRALVAGDLSSPPAAWLVVGGGLATGQRAVSGVGGWAPGSVLLHRTMPGIDL